MAKEKKEKKAALDESHTNGNADTSLATDEISYEDRLNFVSVIAKPMASKKLAKKVSTVIFRFFAKTAFFHHTHSIQYTYIRTVSS